MSETYIVATDGITKDAAARTTYSPVNLDRIYCPICSTPSHRPFLSRPRVPIHQNRIVNTAEQARAVSSGELQLHACAACGFVFNAAFDARFLSYGASYDNTQTYSSTFGKYVQTRVNRVAQSLNEVGGRIVEIGCGTGDFLRAVVERHASSVGVGFDPSYSGPEIDLGGRLQFERRLYDETCGGRQADLVMCRHVIEHIPDPVGLLRVVRRTLGSDHGRVFFETPCVEWILRKQVVWDFFYEHCSYFSAASLRLALESTGFEVDRISHVFGGQYLWAEAHPRHSAGDRNEDRPTRPALRSKVSRLASRFAAHEQTLIGQITNRVRLLQKQGPVAVWGAGAKGVTLANLVDPERNLFACVVDLNPHKQGHYLPGSGHAIVGPCDMASLGVRVAVLTNPRYRTENEIVIRQAGLDVELVDLMRWDDAHGGRRDDESRGRIAH